MTRTVKTTKTADASAWQNEDGKQVWLDLTEVLTAKARKAYEAKREADAVAREAREAFEAVVIAGLNKAKSHPTGLQAIFGYRFGKPSISFVVPKAPKASPSKAGPGLKLA